MVRIITATTVVLLAATIVASGQGFSFRDSAFLGNIAPPAAGAGYTSPTNDSPYAWYDARVNVTNYSDAQCADNQNIKRWDDKSGNGRHLFGPVTDTSSLKLQTAFYNSQNMVEGGSSQWMDNSLLAGGTLSTPCTMYIVWRCNSLSTYVGIIDNTNSTANQRITSYKHNSDVPGIFANGTEGLGPTAFAINTTYVIAFVWDTSSSKIYTNRVLEVTTTVGSATLNGLTVGNLNGHTLGGGYIGELILFSGAHSATKISNTVDWLNYTNHSGGTWSVF